MSSPEKQLSAEQSRQDNALATKADRWIVDTCARRLADRLVSCTGLDRLPVGQAPGVLEKTPLACSIDGTNSVAICSFITARRSENK